MGGRSQGNIFVCKSGKPERLSSRSVVSETPPYYLVGVVMPGIYLNYDFLIFLIMDVIIGF